MKSIYTDILYGNRASLDTIAMSKEYHKLQRKTSDRYDAVLVGLTDKKKNELRELRDLLGEMEVECAECYFAEGFKLGILITAEAYS